MRIQSPILSALLLTALPLLRAQEPIAIIVHPESGVSQLSREEVTNIFMGRQKRMGSGLTPLPVEQVQPQETWKRFYRLLVNKDLAEINAYWARLYFSGQAQPPHRAQSAKDVLDMVAANKGAIGFVEKSNVDRRVKVILILGAPGGQ